MGEVHTQKRFLVSASAAFFGSANAKYLHIQDKNGGAGGYFQTRCKRQKKKNGIEGFVRDCDRRGWAHDPHNHGRRTHILKPRRKFRLRRANAARTDGGKKR